MPSKGLGEEQDQWPHALQGVLFALRTAKHKSTGVSPYEMMFARKPVLPIHFISGDDTSLMESVVSDESGEECLFDYSEIKKNLQMIKVKNLPLNQQVVQMLKRKERKVFLENQRRLIQLKEMGIAYLGPSPRRFHYLKNITL